MRLLLIFVLLAVCCGLAVAQSNSGPPPPPVSVTNGSSPTTPPSLMERMGRDPAFPTRVTGTVLAIDRTRGLMMIELADKSQLTFVVDSRVRARADKDTALAGRKDLALSDYKPGQLVKVSYRVEDNKAVEIRLKRGKS